MKITEKELEITMEELERIFTLPKSMTDWIFKIIKKITKIKTLTSKLKQ